MKRNYILFITMALIHCACITEEDINAITFNTVDNVKLENNKEKDAYNLFANIVINNQNNVQFTLYDFKLKLHWKGEIIDLVYNGGDDKIKFQSQKVSIPIRAEIPSSIIKKNLLSVAFDTILGKKNVVLIKGHIVAKKWMLKKTISINKEVALGL